MYGECLGSRLVEGMVRYVRSIVVEESLVFFLGGVLKCVEW